MFVSVSILKTQVESIRGISDKSMDNPPDWPLIDQSASSSTDHGEDESDAGDDDHIIIGQKSRFATSGANSSTCLPRDSPKTAPVGGFGGKVIR